MPNKKTLIEQDNLYFLTLVNHLRTEIQSTRQELHWERQRSRELIKKLQEAYEYNRLNKKHTKKQTRKKNLFSCFSFCFSFLKH